MRLCLRGPEDTEALGQALAMVTAGRPGGIIFLRGELGAGKTTLARAFLRARGITGTVRSPTYTLVEVYECEQGTVLHLDLYRLAGPAELETLGLADYPPESCWWLVEWPERGAGRLPAATVDVRLAACGRGRAAECRCEPSSGLQPGLAERVSSSLQCNSDDKP